MPSYEITFRDAHRQPEIVHADGVRRSRTAVVFYATHLGIADCARPPRSPGTWIWPASPAKSRSGAAPQQPQRSREAVSQVR
jgi:hypothetical protein